MDVVYYQIQCDGIPDSSTILDSVSEAQFVAQDLANRHRRTCRVTLVGEGSEVLVVQPTGEVIQGTLTDMPPAPQETAVTRGSPPSTYAILAAIEGQPGAWTRVAVSTALRAGLIAPGLYLTGLRGWKLAAGSLAGSASVTAMLFAYYAFLRKPNQASQTPIQAEIIQ